ncbi:MAG TPA: type IV pilus biogenesis/stability protein PilW [Azoarcus sp.]|nr:type IV pilus biogenesis/stability protein PilW [Azoarcus sp.]
MKLRQLLLGAAIAFVLAGCAVTHETGGEGSAQAVPAFLDKTPNNPSERAAAAHVELGTAYFQARRYDVALEEGRLGLAYVRDWPSAYHLIGMVYAYIGDLPAARENFEKALLHAPADPDFSNSYGWFLCGVGEIDEGLRQLELAARNPYYRHPERPHIHAGACHLRRDAPEAAAASFRRGLMFEPNSTAARLGLAEVAYRQGDLNSASKQLTELHRSSELSAASVWLALRVERKLGNRTAAASYAEQLRRRFEGTAEYHAMMEGDYE